MSFASRFTSSLDFDTTLAVVMEAITDVELVVVTEMDLQANLARSLKLDLPRQLVIGTCVPEMAEVVLRQDPAAAVLFPCNITVAELTDGSGTLVAAMRAESTLAGLDTLEIAEEAKAVDEVMSLFMELVEAGVAERAAQAAKGTSGGDWPPALEAIIAEFTEIDDPMERYELLFEYADEVDPLPTEHWTDESRVAGCQSEAHVRASVDSVTGALVVEGAADAQIVQGLIAITVQGLAGLTPAQVLEVPPSFIEAMRLNQSLTPSRSNGFLNMYAKVQAAAKVFADAA